MKKIIGSVYVVLVIFCLSACSFFTDRDGDDMELTQEEIQSANKTTPPHSVTGSSASLLKTLSVYTLDNIGEHLVPLKVPIQSDRITPELIVDKVVENIDEKIVVTEIEIEKQQIYVTFSEDSPPVRKCSKQYETLILDCISNSLLDNLPYIEEVIFHAGKGAYQSDNFTFEADEVYSSK